MKACIRTLQGSAWGMAVGLGILLMLKLEDDLKWGWVTAGNWGPFLLLMFAGIGIAIIAAVVGIIAAAVLLVLRVRKRRKPGQ